MCRQSGAGAAQLDRSAAAANSLVHWIALMNSRFEIHYFLQANEHSAEAFTMTRAGYEVISIIRLVCDEFEVESKIEVEALGVGGIRQIWKLIGRNSGALGIVIGVVGILLQLKPQGDKELIELQKEKLRLEVAELKKKAAEPTFSVSKESLSAAVHELSTDLQIVKRRSNFYHQLLSEPKIEKIEIQKPTQGVWGDFIVNRSDFSDFVTSISEIDPLKNGDAVIGIISPVLRKGRYKWKGEYNGTYIEFWMQDKLFRNQVLTRAVQFKSGTAIRCRMEVRRVVDEAGDIVPAGYYVTLVREVLDNGFVFKTAAGMRDDAKTEAEENQFRLFE